MTYIIEKDLAIPPAKTARSEFFDPLAAMEIGDSFLVTDDDKFSNLKTMAANFKSRYNQEFTTRKVEGGMRIWRTK